MKTETQNSEEKWYAIYTYPNKEKSVYSEIIEMGEEGYLPVQTVEKQWSDRKKLVEMPLFPSYVFVKTDLKRRFRLLKIKGLVKFVAFEGKPVPISDKDIQTIKSATGSPNFEVNSQSLSCHIGDLVTIKEGLFTGSTGKIIHSSNGNSRFAVEIKALRQTVTVDVDVNMIYKPLSKEDRN
ncbi:MAG: UpxY family transcription antiterminator [Bacteroidota bacterium]